MAAIRLPTLAYLFLLALPFVAATPLDITRQVGISCGPNICTNGTVCCNRSCGVCTKPGEKCLTVICPQAGDTGTVEVAAPPAEKRQPEPQGIPRFGQCGPKKCGVSQRCCNAACGHCVGLLEVCLPQVCDREVSGREVGSEDPADGMERANGSGSGEGSGRNICASCL